MTEDEAREALTNWTTQHKQRDTIVRQAVAAGVSKHQVHQITGLARTTIDSILTHGGDMRAYTAVIDANNAVTVIISDDAGDRASMLAVPLGPEDLQGHAERFLATEGWHLTADWEAADGTLRAPVMRGPRADQPDMHDAIVEGVAKYILRGDAHTKNPAHSEAQIAAQVKYQLASLPEYTFPGTTPGQFAAEAQERARYVQDTNPNWDQWAFGH